MIQKQHDHSVMLSTGIKYIEVYKAFCKADTPAAILPTEGQTDTLTGNSQTVLCSYSVCINLHYHNA
ncbi:MAG: hypothetical protein ACI4TB_08280 [Lachnospiraceae bacterium]